MLCVGLVPLRHLRLEVGGEGPVEPQIFRAGDVSTMVMIFRENRRTLKWRYRRKTLLNHIFWAVFCEEIGISH